jgi:N-acetylglutamate synthase-like GNAT family acetyltransferase
LRIRRAQAEDSSTLTKIAQDAKRYWGYPEHWIEHWQDDLTISSDYVGNNQVFLVENNGEIIGFYALIIHENKAELDHMWVTPAHIGAGVGKELFIHAMQTASRRNVNEVGISSDPNAAGFYQKMGAHHAGETISEIDGQSRALPRLIINPKSS